MRAYEEREPSQPHLTRNTRSPLRAVTDSSTSTHHSNNLGERFLQRNQGTSMSPAFTYVFFCGMLMSQWSFTGYDACAHMVEETSNAAVRCSRRRTSAFH